MVRVSPDVIGRGWAFPIDVNTRGGIAMVGGDEEIRQAIIMIVRTRRGGRVMRAEFGCRIWELLFAPNNAATWTLAEHHVREALGMWEPRIEVEAVHALPSPDDPAILEVEIEYQIRATHDARSLVFPFYLIPGEPETVAATNETSAALLEPPGPPAAPLVPAGTAPSLPITNNANAAAVQAARPSQEGPR